MNVTFPLCHEVSGEQVIYKRIDGPMIPPLSFAELVHTLTIEKLNQKVTDGLLLQSSYISGSQLKIIN